MDSFPQALRYFHAGALFNLKELAGNAILGSSISRNSQGRYAPILPQDLEINSQLSSAIRDADLLALLQADLALFNLDGAEVDSGTVVEFIVAKFADIPAVMLRTDFRRSGDYHRDPWNLMLSDYPRTIQVIVQGMELYQSQHVGVESEEAARNAIDRVAEKVIDAFDRLRQKPAVLKPALRESVYEWLSQFASMATPETANLLSLALKEKIAKGLL